MAHQHKTPTAKRLAICVGGPTSPNDSNPRVIAAANYIQEYKLRLRSHKSSRTAQYYFRTALCASFGFRVPRAKRLTFCVAVPHGLEHTCDRGYQLYSKVQTSVAITQELALPPNLIIAPHCARASGSESPGIHLR